MVAMRQTALALVALLLAAGAVAQNPPAAAANPQAGPTAPPAARDSMRRVRIYDDVFPPGTSAFAPRLTLTEGMVYRVEIQPATANISIRSARRPSLPPLMMVPLEGGGPPGATETYSALIVPRSTEEYRLDVTNYGTEPVTVRVETDPKEMSRYARVRAATQGIPMAGLSIRAVYIGAFIRPNAGYSSTPTPTGNASATGVEACFAMLPHGVTSTPWGGCVIAVGRFERPDGAGRLWYIGTEPELELSDPRATFHHSLTFTLGMASADMGASGQESTDYVLYALGYRVATQLAGRHVYLDAEADVASMRESDGFLSGTGKARLVPRLALGVLFGF